MDSNSRKPDKPHVVFLPFPAQGHIKPLLKVAKLLHYRGFHITFVNTEFNHKRFLKSLGPNSLDGLPDFRFETIPDGLPPSDDDATQHAPSLCDAIRKKLSLPPFLDLLKKLNPPVTCIFSDWLMLYSVEAAEQLGVPVIMFVSFAACVFMAISHYPALVHREFAPLKDEECLTNGFLDTVIDWIPGIKEIRLKDLPTFFRTTNPEDSLFNNMMEAAAISHKASAVVIPSFEELEPDVLDVMKSSMKSLNVYTIGPLQLLLNNVPEDMNSKHIEDSLWKEEKECLQWLDTKPPNSVVYVNFGSFVVLTPQQLVEFGMGLVNSNQAFLWIIRPDLVAGESAVSTAEFVRELANKERGLIASWCPQEQVLNHPSIGGFLTHCGWNSTIESLSAGVPMLCWPFFADQQTNCRYSCREWGVGMEIESDVNRDDIEKLLRELMEEGEKGKKMKEKAMEWKKLAQEAAGLNGSSSINFDSSTISYSAQEREDWEIQDQFLIGWLKGTIDRKPILIYKFKVLLTLIEKAILMITGAAALATNLVLHAKVKRVELDLSFVREKVASKSLEVKYIPTEEQLADIFTKAFGITRFLYLKQKLHLQDTKTATMA
ncbi:7-deoxyloganetin glucosyltransferase-like isoform X1 [Ziziphus jujuba]|uniref:7-deoxyloganetin glucosyltransferase-like isoform X1 n=2 Tax=Ziziphus jujuba TaxID=326968 RepID=A0ABM4A713_ZIZJJ|nr:7-deoxyloganetin glucosyltransferase-like isoform X1 [Ziziphus jujuba]